MSTATKPRKSPTKKSEVPSWPYRFAVLPVEHLMVDHDYQRPLTSFVNQVAAKWDPALVGSLVVSERKPTENAVVDGQTRMEAAKRVEVPNLPCLVYLGLTPADEASLFSRLQKERRGIASYHRFRAALVAGERDALDIEALVNDCGYVVGLAGTSEITISAVAALESVYKRGGDILERTLLILKAAWRERIAPPGDIIRGLAYFLDHNKGTDDEKMVRRLSVSSPEELKRRASALREGAGHGGTSDKYIAGAIEGIYNRRGS